MKVKKVCDAGYPDGNMPVASIEDDDKVIIKDTEGDVCGDNCEKVSSNVPLLVLVCASAIKNPDGASLSP